eukprot:scaffold8418_cov106-Isochrysis_galbana.AAC.9
MLVVPRGVPHLTLTPAHAPSRAPIELSSAKARRPQQAKAGGQAPAPCAQAHTGYRGPRAQEPRRRRSRQKDTSAPH